MEKAAGLLTPEERALITDIQDSLIGLFVEHREAIANGDNGRAGTLQVEIDDLLRKKDEIRNGHCRFGLTGRDRLLAAARRLAAKDRDGFADPEDVAMEGIIRRGTLGCPRPQGRSPQRAELDENVQIELLHKRDDQRG